MFGCSILHCNCTFFYWNTEYVLIIEVLILKYSHWWLKISQFLCSFCRRANITWKKHFMFLNSPKSLHQHNESLAHVTMHRAITSHTLTSPVNFLIVLKISKAQPFLCRMKMDRNIRRTFICFHHDIIIVLYKVDEVSMITCFGS